MAKLLTFILVDSGRNKVFDGFGGYDTELVVVWMGRCGSCVEQTKDEVAEYIPKSLADCGLKCFAPF
jgi:hypothetical protein